MPSSALLWGLQIAFLSAALALILVNRAAGAAPGDVNRRTGATELDGDRPCGASSPTRDQDDLAGQIRRICHGPHHPTLCCHDLAAPP